MFKKFLFQALVLVLFAAFAIASSQSDYENAAKGAAVGAAAGYLYSD